MSKKDSQELRNVGLKVTGPRLKILHILENSKQRHLGAEDVHRLLRESEEDVGLATVYRVLTQFETAGLVVRHHFESGHSVFELDQGDHHDHLVCVSCGCVEEFVDDEIEARQAQIALQAGFKMTDHCLNIYGVCKACNEKEN